MERVIEKPWGLEYIITKTDTYVFKMLLVYKGKRLSKQYHKYKNETWFFSAGKAKIIIDDREYYPPSHTDLNDIEDKIFEIPHGTIHRIEAITDCLIYEVSTPELDDIVRLEDDFCRL